MGGYRRHERVSTHDLLTAGGTCRHVKHQWMWYVDWYADVLPDTPPQPKLRTHIRFMARQRKWLSKPRIDLRERRHDKSRGFPTGRKPFRRCAIA